jgi:Flp pilus assembly protein TadG
VSSVRNTDGGSVTAEFAIVVPAVIAVLALVVGAIALGRDALAHTTAAHQAARAIARGDDPVQVRDRVLAHLPGATVDMLSADDEACVTVRPPTGGGVRAWFALPAARACAPRDIWP